MRSDFEILTQFKDTLVEQLASVSGSHFGPTIEGEVYEDGSGLEIRADKYIGVLIDGRGPTKQGAQKGSPTLQQMILDWIRKKSITPQIQRNRKAMTQVQLSWAISKSIHRKGTKLYQQGGGNNIFDPFINDQRIDALLSVIEKSYITKVESINLGEKFI